MMILSLPVFISTNLPAHLDNPITFKARNRYDAIVRVLQRKREVVKDTDRCNENNRVLSLLIGKKKSGKLKR